VKSVPQIVVGLVLLTTAAFAQSPKVTTLVQQGKAALDDGDYPHAVADFQQARELAPESLEANRGLTLSLLQSGNLQTLRKPVPKLSIAGRTMHSFNIGWGSFSSKPGRTPTPRNY
jgi:hypothetical protein